MKELVRRKKVYSVIDPSFVGDRRFAELAKLYGNSGLASRQLKAIEKSEFMIGSVYAEVWGDASGAPDELGYTFVFQGERESRFGTDQISEMAEDIIDDIVADLYDQGFESTRMDVKVWFFDQSGQYVPIEPDADFYAQATDGVISLPVIGEDD